MCKYRYYRFPRIHNLISNIFIKTLEKDVAYIRENLYLPKDGIHVESMKVALTFECGKKKPIKHYYDLGSHLVVPRNFLHENSVLKRFKVRDMRPKKYKAAGLVSSIVPRNELQTQAMEAIKNKNGVLVLPCGSGKTVVALSEIARRNQPTLVIVNTEQIIKQWSGTEDGIQKFLGTSDIGLIRGTKMDWEHPITLATIQTLAKRRDVIPMKVRRYFGLIVWDEVDEMTTHIYSSTADIFMGDRLGLTATPKREDRTEVIYKYHLGDILFENYEFDLMPHVNFVMYTGTLDPMVYETDWGTVSYGALYTAISKLDQRNRLILKLINKKLKEGRKILVLGERVDQLKEFHNSVKDSGLCVNEVEIEARWDMLKTKKIIFATRHLAKRALNQKDLDTLIVMFPMSKETNVKQSCGRILRECKSKKGPEVFVIDDINIDPMHRTCARMMKVFDTLKMPYANTRIR